MTSQALYNRWRSQTFDDVLGQEHITGTLRNQIRAGRVGHAYLFTGVRGTGKTSTARILAKAVNCIGETDDPPCNACRVCESITAGRSLDLIEIDGASNRGIDEIRELRERVSFVPQDARYKVYVIDEVHMLTREAFNGLLKTLEEPPQHVIFVLCTTEAHRLPDTILSRCQRFDFRRAPVRVIAQKLARICEAEGVGATPEALEYIARRGAGSFRDAESLLDQVAAYAAEEVDLALVQRVLGVASADSVTQLIAAMVHGDAALGLRLINEAMDQGADPRQFLGEILDQLRAMLLMGVGSQDDLGMLSPVTVEALEALLHDEACSLTLLTKAIRAFQTASQELRNAVRLQLPLELALVEVVVERDRPEPSEPRPSEASPTSAAAETPRRQPSKVEGREAAPPEAGAETVTGEAPQAAVPPAESEHTPPLALDWVRARWRQVLNKVAVRNPSVGSALNVAYPLRVREGVITIGCAKPFERDTLADAKRSSLVEQVLAEVLGVACRIECVVAPPPAEEAGAHQGAGADDHLFAAADRQEERERALREHPAVKALEQRGGRVTRIELNEDDE
jgi:DNA polymerase III subunit gamma/tau